MKSTLSNPRRLGAIPLGESTSFRVWAPFASGVSVVGEFNDWKGDAHPLQRDENGYWAIEVPGAKAGQQYQFEITNGDRRFRKNDARVREIHPKTALGVIYSDGYKWKTQGRVLQNWNELVLYELHVGTFSPGPLNDPGRFEQVIRRLPYLKSLGVNALEIMPPMAFPSERSWGYSLTNPFAIEASYGGPDAFKRLIDAAHEQGIGIILDVVYNHFGPDDLDLWQYDGWSENGKGGIYFYNDHRSWTPWGENRPDYGRPEVREYIRDNTLFWLEEFHVDGLRFDATAFIRNTRGENNNPETDLPDGWSLLRWLTDEVQKHFPGAITIAEDIQQNPWLTKPTKDDGAGFGTQWDMAFLWPLRTNIVKIDDADRSMDEIANAIKFRYNEDAIQRVIYSESHDEVANGKARVPQQIDPDDTGGYFAKKRSTLAAGLVLTTPGIPMLFEGQEFLEDGWFRDDKALDWSKLDAFKGINRLYRDLIYHRRNLYGQTKGLMGPYVNVHHVNDKDKVIAFHRWLDGGAKDDVIVVASFSHRTIEGEYRIGLPRGGKWIIRFNSDWKGYSPEFHDVSNAEGTVEAQPEPHDGCPFSGHFSLPPYGLLILSQDELAVESQESASDEAEAA
jgi:1,4-alpha-glucan branching enzyme